MEKDLCGCRIIHEDKVTRARTDALELHDIERLSQIFKALADPSRLRILYALTEQEMCVCDLAALLEITESAVSHQLRLLRTMKLVANRREGNILYYRLVESHVTVLISIALEHLREEQQVNA
jgi:DNA-binding transcriptional ArsR family regulator